jgi:TadE-like protein
MGLQRGLPDMGRCARRGTALLELAVAIPVLLLFTMGVVDYARLYYASIAVASAAMAGAQYGTPYGVSDSIVVGARRDAGSVTLDSVTTVRFCRCPDNVVADCVNPGTCPGTYGEVQQYDSVRVRKDVALLIRYVGLPSRITIVRTAVVRSN